MLKFILQLTDIQINTVENSYYKLKIKIIKIERPGLWKINLEIILFYVISSRKINFSQNKLVLILLQLNDFYLLEYTHTTLNLKLLK